MLSFQKVKGLFAHIFKMIRIVKVIIIRQVQIIISFFLCIHKIRCSKACTISAMTFYESQSNSNSVSKTTSFIKENPIVDLSIIIPCYNCEKYICECLDSVLAQITRYSYEIIIINDGSTDNTAGILLDYSANQQIKTVTQENCGQSVARNRGISSAYGRYLMFVDADDVLLPGAIESLMKVAEETNSDIVEGSIVRFYNQISEEMIRESRGRNRIESNSKSPRFVLTSFGYSWAKVYRRELWTSLRFPEGYIFEDVITKFILRRKSNQIAFIEDVVYGYRQNSQSSSHGSNQQKKLDSIWVLPKVFELCKQENTPRDDVFYLLSLNHIGLLNYTTTRSQSTDIRLSCFVEMRKQLLSIQDCRPRRMPLMFKLLDRAILEKKCDAWEYIAETIQKYHMLKKWREIY